MSLISTYGIELEAPASVRSGPGEDTAARGACQGCRGGKQLFPFTMAFQPIIDVQDRRIDAYEALVRGPRGESAGSVLGQVDKNNLYAFDQACRVKAIELAASLEISTRLNINFLPNAVYEPRACIKATLDAALRTGFDPRRLTFEIVETEAIADTPHILNIIREYRRQGFQIALDDFGTGHSNLVRLAELRPDIVKLDRALIAGCSTDDLKLAIIESILKLGDKAGVKIVIEGVETLPELQALRSVGARFLQGFLFARPQWQGLETSESVLQRMP